MKRIVSLILIVVMVLVSVAGCNKPQESGGKEAIGEEKLEVATVPKATGIVWFDSMDEHGEEWAKANNANHRYIGPKDFDAAAQLQYVNDAISLKPDILTVVPIAADAVDEALKRAINDGIMVVTHEGSTLKNINYDVEAFNNKEFGAHFVDIVADKVGEDVEYALTVGRLTVPSHNEWAQAFYDKQQKDYPNMKSVTGENFIESMDNPEEAYEVGKQLIQTYPNMKVIFTASASSTMGFCRAVEELGKVGEVRVIGLGTPSSDGEAVKKGSALMISFWVPGYAQKACYEIGKMAIEGKEIKSGLDLGAPGYEDIIVDGKIIMGSAWIDCYTDDVDKYVDEYPGL